MIQGNHEIFSSGIKYCDNILEIEVRTLVRKVYMRLLLEWHIKLLRRLRCMNKKKKTNIFKSKYKIVQNQLRYSIPLYHVPVLIFSIKTPFFIYLSHLPISCCEQHWKKCTVFTFYFVENLTIYSYIQEPLSQI